MNRVLIVDDEHLIRSSLSKKVSEISPIVAVSGNAENGHKALEWLELYHADICITDVSMPIVNGLQLLEAIRDRYPWMHGIVVSSYDDFEYVRESLKQGAIDYILKPVEQDSLVAALNKAVAAIQKDREDRARKLLLNHLSHHRVLMEEWVNKLKLGELNTLPLLVVHTLEVLESWTTDRLDLLFSLSFAWLQMVGEELSKDQIHIELEEGLDIGLGEELLPREKVRFYFRLGAVRRLEEGAAALHSACQALLSHPKNKAIEHAKAFIEENYAAKLTLQEIAEQATMSRSYFANIFKQETGITVWNFIANVRMSQARKLLLDTSMKVYEIAMAVGYDNAVYFTQLFKEHYGVTPAEYKKRMGA
jgi:two-component system response regulator YesN